ncbi:hypothetical protein M6D93_17890 [Jatrophihabitans telluris]|uniref:Pilus assembly protein TadE n=1 Tax=Jatrophihabitans telluris TaxID=2038343 RepID=A0ABY4QZ66_9ACTN|nr:TadE family type IV pilus minor pilin [Jatrophihabitans telluris]UQX88141.1 hypothetical protein M6D93_17890 [Jatrophihabitans telluris]
MVTAELATALPVLVLLFSAGLAAVQVGQLQLRVSDAAREGARALARGEPGGPAPAVAAVLGGGAEVSVGAAGPDLQRVSVRATYRPVTWLPGVTVDAAAVTGIEPAASSVQRVDLAGSGDATAGLASGAG